MSGANVDIAVVVLAAGEARRFGRAKQVALLDGAPMVRRAAIAALRTGARVAVVTGAYREEVETTLRDLPLGRVYNADWASGMGGSIAAGIAWLDALEPIASAAIVALADQPRIGAAELLELIRAHREDATSIVAARYAAITGPPCLFPRRYFAELKALASHLGARSLVERHAAAVRTLAMPAGAIDIDTREDYVRLVGEEPD